MADVDEENKSFSLPSLLNIENIKKVKEDLSELNLRSGKSLILDASITEMITTPGIQLLISLDKTISQDGGHLELTGAQENFVDALRAIGLEKYFDKWSGIDG